MVIPTLMYRIANGENPVRFGVMEVNQRFAYSKIYYGTILALYYGTRGKYINLEGYRNNY